jgi:hypothetical protein
MELINTSRLIKNYQISFRKDILDNLHHSKPSKIAVLVSNEYEGLSRNGGIGTYYTALSKKMKEAGWTIILLYCQSEEKFHGKSKIPALDYIFSTGEIFDSLILQPSQLSILNWIKEQDSATWQSLSCFFYIQSIAQAFKDLPIYIEFHDIHGFGYHTFHAKQVGILPANCLTAITIHGCFEWVFEAGDATMTGEDWFWRSCFREQQSYERADLTFFPSHYLRSKVESYGWNNANAIHMPYFIPFASG